MIHGRYNFACSNWFYYLALMVPFIKVSLGYPLLNSGSVKRVAHHLSFILSNNTYIPQFNGARTF